MQSVTVSEARYEDNSFYFIIYIFTDFALVVLPQPNNKQHVYICVETEYDLKLQSVTLLPLCRHLCSKQNCSLLSVAAQLTNHYYRLTVMIQSKI